MHQYYLTFDGLYVCGFNLQPSKRECTCTAHSNSRLTFISVYGARSERDLLRAAFPEATVKVMDQGPDGNSVVLD